MSNQDLLEKFPCKGSEIIFREIESKSVLLNIETGNYYTLNKTGTFMWSLMDGKTNVRGFIELLMKNFEVARQEATEDVLSLISTLKKEGLVAIHDKPGQP